MKYAAKEQRLWQEESDALLRATALLFWKKPHELRYGMQLFFFLIIIIYRIGQKLLPWQAVTVDGQQQLLQLSGKLRFDGWGRNQRGLVQRTGQHVKAAAKLLRSDFCNAFV